MIILLYLLTPPLLGSKSPNYPKRLILAKYNIQLPTMEKILIATVFVHENMKNITDKNDVFKNKR
jgi:hypothetical protein